MDNLNHKQTLNKDLEFKFGRMGQNIQEYGKMIRQTDLED